MNYRSFAITTSDYIPLGPFQIFSKIRGDIRSSRFATGVNDIGGKFAACVVDIGGNLPLASLTPVANLPPVSLTPVANLLPVSLIPVVNLELRISPQIFKKI